MPQQIRKQPPGGAAEVRRQPEQAQQGRDIHEAERRQPPAGDRGAR